MARKAENTVRGEAEVFRFVWRVPMEECYWYRGRPGCRSKQGPWLRYNSPTDECEPLKNEALFRKFSGLYPPTEETIVDFVTVYGYLGVDEEIPEADLEPGDTAGRGESWQRWGEEINNLHLAIEVWDLLQAGEDEVIGERLTWVQEEGRLIPKVRYVGEAGQLSMLPFAESLLGSTRHIGHLVDVEDVGGCTLLLIQNTINQRLTNNAAPRVLYDRATRRARFRIVPTNLLGALWLQFALSISGNKRFGVCRECNDWFEISLNKNRQSREFCKDACRQKYYREKKERVCQLAAEGKSAKVIAEEVGSEIHKVEQWVAAWKKRSGKG